MELFGITLIISSLSLCVSVGIAVMIIKMRHHQESALDHEIKRAIHVAITKETGEAENTLSDLIQEKVSRYLADVHRDILKTLKAEESGMEQGYEKTINDIRDYYKKSIEESLAEMKTLLASEFAGLKSTVAMEYRESGETISAQFTKMLNEAEAEIAAYKTARIERIEVEVTQRVQEILKSVLKESLTQDDHERLIREAVTKALATDILR